MYRETVDNKRQMYRETIDNTVKKAKAMSDDPPEIVFIMFKWVWFYIPESDAQIVLWTVSFATYVDFEYAYQRNIKYG